MDEAWPRCALPYLIDYVEPNSVLCEASVSRAKVILREPAHDRSGCYPLVRRVSFDLDLNLGLGTRLTGATRPGQPRAARLLICSRCRATERERERHCGTDGSQ